MKISLSGTKIGFPFSLKQIPSGPRDVDNIRIDFMNTEKEVIDY